MNSFYLSGVIISSETQTVKGETTVTNILLYDHDNPTRQVYKIALWDNDAIAAQELNVDVGDEIAVHGKIYNIGNNKCGSYIEVRQCKLDSIQKIERKQVYKSDSEETSLTEEECDPDD